MSTRVQQWFSTHQLEELLKLCTYHSVHEIYQHFIKVREMILTNLERICFFLVQLFNTAVDEGGKFISRQVGYIISKHQ